MTQASFARELAGARQLGERAGALLLGYHGSGIAVQGKAGGEPVTQADLEASALIVKGLAEAFPSDHILSEEAPDEPTRRLAAHRVWMVDPMDGTKDFVAGHDGFSVMIGLCVDQRPVLGVIYQPLGALTYFAAPGIPATLVRNGVQHRLAVSSVADPGAVRLVASKSHRDDKIDAVRAALGTRDELNVGSVGLKLGLIARGDRDLYVNPSSMSSKWDTCAPEALLHAAGGRLTDLYGDPIRYDVPVLKNDRGLLASNGVVHDAVRAKLATIFPSPPA